MGEILLLLVMFWNLENFFDPFEGNSNNPFKRNSNGYVHNGVADTLGLQNKKIVQTDMAVLEENAALADTVVQKVVEIETVKHGGGRKSEESVDEPFTPQGEKFWTWKKFARKRDDIARTICLVAEENGIFPAIMGLCEVENRFVLEQLTQNTILAKLDYGIIHKDSPDRRGIDAALLYRKELFSPVKVRFIPTLSDKSTPIPTNAVAQSRPGSMKMDILPSADTLPSRETVYVKGVFRGLDTLHCFVVHWPSKLGGEKGSLPRRMAASNTLKQVIDSILLADCRANIMVMGDFNDNAESESVASINNLVNISKKERERIGERQVRREPYRWFTYKYKESWSRIDHFLVSENLWEDSSKGYSGIKWLYCTPQSGCVFGHESLLEKDKNYFGYKIRRTLTGPRYNGGVSDHLPIILKVWGYEY